MPDVLILDSATQFDGRHAGRVVVTGSHGGRYPGYLAARAHVRGVTFNDAGIGKDQAGIASLPYLDALGIPAATVGHASARIADGADICRRGIVSHINRTAAALGCVIGEHVLRCAERMHAAAPPIAAVPTYGEARIRLRSEPNEAEIWALDSAALMRPEDRGCIVVTASHGALLAGRPDHIVQGPPLAAFFNDAGIGADEAGVGRLPVLDEMGITAATVSAETAQIGDARSSWESGVLSRVNRCALEAGARNGMTLQAFALRLARSRAIAGAWHE